MSLSGSKDRSESNRPTSSEELREGEEPYRILFESNPHPLWVYDLESLAFLAVNDAAISKYGYSRQEFLAMTIADIRPREDVPRLLENVANVTDGMDEAGVWRHRRKDGTIMDVEIISHTLIFEGRKAELVLANDITERKKVEDALRESEERLKFMISNSPAITYLCRPSGDFGATFVTPNIVKQLGYEPDAFTSDPGFWAAHIHPDDAPGVLDNLSGLFDKGTHFHEYRFRHKDGTWRWMQDELKLIRDEAGNPIEIVGVWNDITEWKLAEEALRESEEKFKTIFDFASDGILIVDPGTKHFVEGNDTIARMLGVTTEALPMMKVEDIHPADSLQDVLQSFGKATSREREPMFADNIPVLRKDGSVFFADIASSWIKLKGVDYMAGFFRDTTDRKQMQQALMESEREYRMLFDSANDAIFILDLHGNFINANKTAYTRLGYSRQDMLSMHVSQIDSPEFATKVPERIAQLSRYGEAVFEAAHIRKDGSVMPVEVNARLMDYKGQPVLFSISRDITERKKAEQERLELERRLLHSQKLESLGVLAGGIAHDFNNLLMAILGNLDLALLSIPSGSPARANIEQSAKAARRATDLTRQMLAYSGRGSFIVKAMDLNELVEENSRLFRAAISTTTTLSLRLGHKIPQIKADAGQIQQVIMNLITNASEAIGEKPGVILLTTGVLDGDVDYLRQTRTEEVPPPGRFVLVEVSDTGMGMDNETQQRLFDPFFTRKKTGRGLGMSAILGIVRGHRGAVLVDSTLGKGTAIRVLFPALADEQALKEAATGAGVADAKTSAPSGTVLVVDDEEGVLSVCKDMVTYMGAKVLTASNGSEALSVFQERASEIDLVILDLSMPVMDGMTTLPELLRIKPDVKVILSSGFDRDDAMKGFTGKGIAEFIQKPYSLNKLRLALQNALKSDS